MGTSKLPRGCTMGLFSKKKFDRLQESERVEKKHTIMIVDDEPSNLSTLSSMLADRYRLIEAHDGLEAFEILTQQIPPNTVSCIISDQRMPRLSGTDLFCRLIPIMPRTIRIILTGYTDVSAILDSVNKAQIYKFVVKPFDREDLLLTVARALESYEMREEIEEHQRNLENRIRERTIELEEKNAEILRTQNQLILQEKMASTGILAAGIAHELKNPLNFVNNFAGVSIELFKEFRERFDPLQHKVEQETWSFLDETLADLVQNADLIRQHGMRANRIVQSMMSLSRSDSGKLQPTDINDLIIEFVELAYNGLRVKGLTVDVQFLWNLASDIKKIPVMSQSLSRVILNLSNNAFESLQSRFEREADFKPVFSVETQRLDGLFEIIMSDNGEGIAVEHRERIFNPFYTTKAAGSGNIGLGLSVCYDIIVHEHGGKIQVESIPRERTTFRILLPLDPSEIMSVSSYS
jgi:signal transduction histidine kinase